MQETSYVNLLNNTKAKPTQSDPFRLVWALQVIEKDGMTC